MELIFVVIVGHQPKFGYGLKNLGDYRVFWGKFINLEQDDAEIVHSGQRPQIILQALKLMPMGYSE